MKATLMVGREWGEVFQLFKLCDFFSPSFSTVQHMLCLSLFFAEGIQEGELFPLLSFSQLPSLKIEFPQT